MYDILLSSTLVAAVLLLIVMVPGGPLETRSFAHLPRAVFWGFNLFLISLGIASFVVAGGAILGAAWAPIAALVIGVGYVLVFALDLAKIFPATPDEMSSPLLLLEVADLVVGGIVVVVAVGGMIQ
ncbi:hypothetical protein HDC94_000984 [Leifsonia sp. AK011]|uniref:hypothetical protein n=1 Tax=Leifsonia sp. AK011 TaxID=2723075 RepID=UPI0015C71913|nr:hypothetical protein [Leifsonia sp. AK011]NYF09828.1 hypothetical protein [Leifsonia sp. AK011]